MARYFRTKRPGSDRNDYFAVSEKTVPTEKEVRNIETNEYYKKDIDEHPIGSVSIKYTPRTYIPNFTTEDTTGFGKDWQSLSRVTGLSQQFLNHLNDTTREQLDNRHDDDYDRISELNDALNPFHHSVDRGIDFAKSVSTIRKSPEGNPETLFTDIPPNVKITDAFFDSKVTHLFPTTVSLIKQDHPGAEILASHDLSPYSSRIAQRAAERGLITGGSGSNEDMRITNDIGFAPQRLGKDVVEYMEGDDQEIPQEEVSKARQSLRNELRASRPRKSENKLSNQFDHPKLPGMEGF